MNLLTIENITKAFTERKLFDEASFFLAEGEKVGIIGMNGTGKSTLLKMIAGLEEADSGIITRANHVVVSYLPQHPEFEEGDKVLSSIMKNPYAVENEAKAMLDKLGITDYDAVCANLSGGQRKKIALVKVLLSPADILILDEPTNHLDNEMAGWLEEKLKRRKGALVMVTHDRYFLDSVSNRIVEIDNGKIYSYQSNYSGFLELKMQREEMQAASERKRQTILRNELAWVQRGARARSTKQKARLERYETLKSMEAANKAENVELSSVSTRLGRTTLELSHIHKSFGDKNLIHDFSYIFLKKDRIGFIGKNGCGKTTLIRIIAGLETVDCGSIEIGQTVKLGYYAQETSQTDMKADKRVIDYVKEVAEFVKTMEGSITASQMLERFLFTGDMQYSLIGKLSGGEKRRLHLLRVLMEAPNILLLDEPTNDLDISTLTILEDYLDSFQGIVAVVSHDRYFLDRTVGRIFAFEEGGILKQYEGGYTDYTIRKSMEAEEESIVSKTSKGKKDSNASKEKPREKKLKFTYQEQKDYDNMEFDILEIEEKLQIVEAEIGKYASDFMKLNELSLEKDKLEKLQEEKLERWMYLEELTKQIENQ